MINNRYTVMRSIAIRDCGAKTFEVWIRHATLNFITLIKKCMSHFFLSFDEDEKTFSFFSEMTDRNKISAKIHQNDYISDNQRNFACKQLDIL